MIICTPCNCHGGACGGEKEMCLGDGEWQGLDGRGNGKGVHCKLWRGADGRRGHRGSSITWQDSTSHALGAKMAVLSEVERGPSLPVVPALRRTQARMSQYLTPLPVVTGVLEEACAVQLFEQIIRRA